MLILLNFFLVSGIDIIIRTFSDISNYIIYYIIAVSKRSGKEDQWAREAGNTRGRIEHPIVSAARSCIRAVPIGAVRPCDGETDRSSGQALVSSRSSWNSQPPQHLALSRLLLPAVETETRVGGELQEEKGTKIHLWESEASVATSLSPARPCHAHRRRGQPTRGAPTAYKCNFATA